MDGGFLGQLSYNIKIWWGAGVGGFQIETTGANILGKVLDTFAQSTVEGSDCFLSSSTFRCGQRAECSGLCVESAGDEGVTAQVGHSESRRILDHSSLSMLEPCPCISLAPVKRHALGADKHLSFIMTP